MRNSRRLSHVDRAGKKRTVHAITDYDNESEERMVYETNGQEVLQDNIMMGVVKTDDYHGAV